MKLILAILFILISISLNNCTNRTDSQISNKTEHPSIFTNNLQDTTLIKEANIDTNSIIANIRRKYYFMIENKKEAEIKTSKSFENHEDSEPDGEYSKKNLIDTLFLINDSLSYSKTVNDGENHINSYFELEEVFYDHDVIFFKFTQNYRYINFHNESIIEEKRYYYYKGKIVRCIERHLTFSDAIDISVAIDSLSNTPSYKCKD